MSKVFKQALRPYGTMASVAAVLDGLEKKLGSLNFWRIFQTITVDNGSEFQDWEGMTRAAAGAGMRTSITAIHTAPLSGGATRTETA